MSIVIYAIECRKNGRTFVGHSADPLRRWRNHRHQMRRGSHHTPTMLADWRKHGASAFALRVLEALPHTMEPH